MWKKSGRPDPRAGRGKPRLERNAAHSENRGPPSLLCRYFYIFYVIDDTRGKKRKQRKTEVGFKLGE